MAYQPPRYRFYYPDADVAVYMLQFGMHFWDVEHKHIVHQAGRGWFYEGQSVRDETTGEYTRPAPDSLVPYTGQHFEITNAEVMLTPFKGDILLLHGEALGSEPAEMRRWHHRARASDMEVKRGRNIFKTAFRFGPFFMPRIIKRNGKDFHWPLEYHRPNAALERFAPSAK